jgi:predicted phosphoribosyltransferase
MGLTSSRRICHFPNLVQTAILRPPMSERFDDRRAAGRVLAEILIHHADQPDLVVLGLPRGGVPVAYEVAQRLHAPLDVFVVRKLGVPGHEELAMGAIASGGVRVLNIDVVASAGLSQHDVDQVAARELETLSLQEQRYRGERPPPELAGMSTVLVDDGLATGATMRAAIEALRRRGVASIVMAVPVGPRETCAALAGEVDEAVCALQPDPFTAVGLWYRDFSPVSDDAVTALLNERGPGD